MQRNRMRSLISTGISSNTSCRCMLKKSTYFVLNWKFINYSSPYVQTKLMLMSRMHNNVQISFLRPNNDYFENWIYHPVIKPASSVKSMADTKLSSRSYICRNQERKTTLSWKSVSGSPRTRWKWYGYCCSHKILHPDTRTAFSVLVIFQILSSLLLSTR